MTDSPVGDDCRERGTLWTRKLRKLKIHLASRVHNEVSVVVGEDKEESEPIRQIDGYETEGEYNVVSLPWSAWHWAESGGTGAGMTGMLLTPSGEPRTFSRTWSITPGASNAPEMYPGLDMVFYAESGWDWEHVREVARATIDRYIEASLRPEFAYEWHVLNGSELQDVVDWYVYHARTPSHAFVKPEPVDERAFDPERTGARQCFEYIGTWEGFAELVEGGARWPDSDSKTIALDHDGDSEALPDGFSDVLKLASDESV